jgi:hypothetical protein
VDEVEVPAEVAAVLLAEHERRSHHVEEHVHENGPLRAGWSYTVQTPMRWERA